jgi:hypothetical protein
MLRRIILAAVLFAGVASAQPASDTHDQPGTTPPDDGAAPDKIAPDPKAEPTEPTPDTKAAPDTSAPDTKVEPRTTTPAVPSAPGAAAADVRAEPSAPPPDITAAPGKGITFNLGKTFSSNIRVRFQPRWQLHAAPPSMGDRTFDQLVNINTARIWLSGHALDPKLLYMLQLALGQRDYRDGAVTPIFDAFVDYKAHRELSLRAGQFFVAFDRLRTVREFSLQLIERPRPVAELTLDRDVGVTLYSDAAFLGPKSPLAWRVGIFGGGGMNLRVPKQPGGLFVGRIEIRPLGEIDDDSEGDLKRRKKPGLALGAGIATNRNTNRQRSTTGMTFTGGTTDYNHYAIDAVVKWRGVALQAEYLWKRASTERIPSAADPAVIEWARSGSGYVLQGSYTFDPPVEIVARYSRLYAPGGTDPKWITEVRNLGQEIATGVNYYLNGHQFKFQADWIVRSPRDFSFDGTDQAVHVQADMTF